MEYIDICENCPYKNGTHLAAKFQNIERGIKPTNYEINGSTTLIVLQSPGVEEWKEGGPLKNRDSSKSAYTRISKSWERKHFSRENFDIANIVLCYQGKNTIINRDKRVSGYALTKCSNRLKEVILRNNYQKLIVFGSPAKKRVKKIIKELKDTRDVTYCGHPCAGRGKPSNEKLDELW